MTASTLAWLAAAGLIVSGCGGLIAFGDHPNTESPDADTVANTTADAATITAPHDADSNRQEAGPAINRGGISAIDAGAETIDIDAATVGEEGEGGNGADVAQSDAAAAASWEPIDAAEREFIDGRPEAEQGARSSDGACAWTLILDGNLLTGSRGRVSTAIGDLNGDGEPDVAVVDSQETSVNVFFGSGDGAFRAGASYPAGMGPWSVAIADLNGDRHPDLVVPNYLYGEAATVSVLIGLGDGTFGVATPYDVGVDPQSVAIGDLNGDRHPDLIVPNSLDGTVSVLLGKGDGTFGPQVTYPVFRAAGPAGLGDLNGDGKLDVVVTNAETGTAGPSGSVSVLLGNGDGTLKPRVLLSAGFNPSSVAIGDLNADGKLDLAVADLAYGAEVLLGNGDGTFQAYTRWPTGILPNSIAIADLNGDGALDLALTNGQDATVSALLGYGDGTFANQVTFATGSSPCAVAAGDLNGDGYSDLVVGLSGSGYANVFLSTCQP